MITTCHKIWFFFKNLPSVVRFHYGFAFVPLFWMIYGIIGTYVKMEGIGGVLVGLESKPHIGVLGIVIKGAS